jgi:transcriptional regulator with XRE-family HTH domain
MSNQSASGITGLRSRLASSHPKFAEADAFERQIDNECMRLRARLREARKKLGVDQSSLAERMQVGQPVISRIENGTGDIGVKTLYRYADALGLSLTFDIRLEEDRAPSAQLTPPPVDVLERALEALETRANALQGAKEALDKADEAVKAAVNDVRHQMAIASDG